MIDLAILGLLDGDELHGYELRKRLGELLGSRLAVSYGSLYPALNRLEAAGNVKAVSGLPTPAPPSPMSGSLAGELAAYRARRRATGDEGGRRSGGRGKKVYGVTDGGRRRLHELLVDPDVSDDRAFAVRVAFCHHLTRSERIELFERRRAELARRLDQRRRATSPSGRVGPYLRSLLERDTEALVADVAWLDRLLAAERADPHPDSAVDPDPGGHP